MKQMMQMAAKGFFAKGLFATAVMIIACANFVTYAKETDWPKDGPDALSAHVASAKIRSANLAATGGKSGYAPPVSNDIQIVVTKGGDIGVQGDSSHPCLKIPLNIHRVYGDVKKLTENNSIPKRVVLKMIVFDVDSDYQGGVPEIDRVSVNNHEVGYLSGHTDVWTYNDFWIPIEYLNLKKKDGDSGYNEIKIDVAIKGGGWVTKVDWVAIEIPAPPPVVIAHGIFDSAAGNTALVREIESLGLPVHIFDFDNKGCNSIRDGARQLATEVQNAKSRFHVDHVNIVAHSMGGLKAREYTETAHDVLKVLQIATPNFGAPTVDAAIYGLIHSQTVEGSATDLIDAMAELFPAIPDLSVAHMKDYNTNHHLNSDVYYRVVAGVVTGGFATIGYIGGSILYGADDGIEGDGIVPLISAHSIVTPYTVLAPDSLNVISSPVRGAENEASHTALVVDNVNYVVNTFLREDLLSPKQLTATSSPSGVSMPDPSTTVTLDDAVARLTSSIDLGTINVGETAVYPFEVVKGNNTTVCVKIGDCEDFELYLTSPSGKSYGSSTGNVSIKMEGGTAIIILSSPETGTWTVSIKPKSSLSGASKVSYLTLVDEVNTGIEIDAVLVSDNVRAGEPFVINVMPTIDGQTIVGTVEAYVTPSGNVSKDDVTPVVLARNSQGVFTGQLPTTVAGNYDIAVSVEATAPVAFKRGTLLTGVAADSSTAFTGSVSFAGEDSDGNGLYDSLVALVGVNVTKDGTYRLYATLSDADSNEVIQETWTTNVYCYAGAQNMRIDFSGTKIYAHGQCSGYKLSNARLLEIGDNYDAVVDTITDVAETSDYLFSQFEHATLRIGVGGSDEAVDTDGDNLYDSISVMLPLVAEDSAAETYRWSATLADTEGQILSRSYGTVAMEADSDVGNMMKMVFPMKEVIERQIEGSFVVSNILLWNQASGRYIVLDGTYHTAHYPLSKWSFAASDGTSAEAVVVTWKGNADAATYQIWRSEDDYIENAVQIGTSDTLSYSDTTAIPGKFYYYWVRAVVNGVAEEFGTPDSGFRALPAPTDVSASTTYTDYVLVKWLPVADAKSYRVYRSSNTSDSQGAEMIAEVVYSLPGNSGAHIGLYYVEYQDRTAEVGAGYYYWIKSVGENATIDFSERAYGGRRPLPPTGVSATDGTYSGGVVVTWRPAEGATRYNVYSSTDDSRFCAQFIGSTDRCAFYDTAASGGEIYHYWVEASTPAAYSDYSDSDTGWRRATISGNAPYVVIDLSQGPTAERFPCYEMWQIPGGTSSWPREYKTDKLVLKRIAPGSFTMGSPKNEVGRINTTETGYRLWDSLHGQHDADEDLHVVTLDQPYYIGVFEVTCKQWSNIGVGYAPSYTSSTEAWPAYNVTYATARANYSGLTENGLVGILRRKSGLGKAVDLPTEAQWEYACRAGMTTALNNGYNLTKADVSADANLDKVARYDGNGGYYGPADVGSYAPNNFGLYDMHGNVAEWCRDWFKVDRWYCARLRGGSHDDEPSRCRSASRVTLKIEGVLNYNDSGVRLVVNVPDIENGSGADDPVWFVDNGELVVYEPNGVKNVVIPDGVTCIGKEAFVDCTDLVSVKMPNSVTNIGDSAFENCQNLKTVSLSTGLREIGRYAFCGCSSLQTVTIPNSVKNIGAHAFCDCETLARITVDNGNVVFKSVDGILYTKDGTKLVCCPGGKTGSVTVPEGVKRIEECAFGFCDKLKSVALPKSLESIGSAAFAEELCDNEAIPGVLLVDGWAVESDWPSDELDLKGVKGIADYCFEYTDITAVTIPEGVKRIPMGAFACCENLSRVSIPDSVEYVERGRYGYDDPFKSCDDSLYDYESIPGVVLVDGWVMRSIRSFSGDVDLSATRGIANWAFYFSDVTGVILPQRLKHVGEGTFVGGEFESISIPDGVLSIDAEAFGCSYLRTITIPKSVMEIGDDAFGSCFDLTDITFEGNAPSLVGNAFYGRGVRTTVYVPYDSTGWGVTIPGTWNKMKISYIGETPDMIRCNVTFDASGGKPAKQTIKQIATVAWNIVSLQVPTKSESVFDGWYTEKTGGEKVDLEGVCGLSGDTTLYAHWLKAYSATAKDGSVYTDGTASAATVSAVNGTRLYLQAVDKSDSNMEFAYWSYTPATAELGEDFDPRAPHAECVMPEANVTFTANYVAKPGHVRVYAHEVNGTANADGAPEGIEWSADGKFWLAANDDRAFPVKAGKTTIKFRSADPRWTVPTSATYVIDSDSAFRDIDIAATRVAIVEADSLSEQSGASGTVTLNPKNGQVLSGKPVTLTAKPGKDTVFAYWLVNDEKVGYAATFKYAPDADCTVTAVFRLKSAVENPALDVDAVVPSVNAMVGVAFEASVPIADAAYPAKFSAKGLPAGLKIDAASGMISGVPTKAGDYAVTIATAGGANGKAKSSITLPIAIKPLPGWAQGTFTGHVRENDAEYGLASLTVSGAGKVSGKMTLNGTNWTFAAASYDATSHTDEEDEAAMSFAVVADAKAGKNVFPVSLNVWKAAAPDGDGAGLLNSSALGSEMWGGNPVNVRFFRNIWKDKVTAAEAKAELAKREGVYTLSLAPDLCGGFGSGYLSLTVSKDGNVKAAGKLADGTSVSATSPLVYDADFGYFAYFHVAPSAYKGGVFALTVSFDEVLGALGNTPGIAQWKNRNPQATGKYGEGFSRRGSFTGAYYDKLAKLTEYYDSLRFSVDGTPSLSYTYKETCLDGSNKKVTATETQEANAIDLSGQSGLSVAVDGKGALVVAKATKPVQDKETKEWYYDGANDGALTLSFAQATGIFKGAYTFWFDYMSAYDETTDKTTMAHTSKKVNFEGIRVQGNDGMRGFYLWDAAGSYLDEKTKKEKAYKFKMSFPVSLLSE